MTAGTILDIEAIEHLDFDVEPTCDAIIWPCTRTAVWRMTRTCCDAVFLLCDLHKNAETEYIQTYSSCLFCILCDSALTPEDIEFERFA